MTGEAMTTRALDFAAKARGCCHDGQVDMASPDRSRWFWVGWAALFLASAGGTVAWGASMAAMEDMPMPGGWTMSMAWMRMPEQSWVGATLSFLGMWTLMMVAMMTPSLVPALWRHRRAVIAFEKSSEARAGVLGAIVAAGYFLVWAAQGALVFPLGVALAAAAMRWPALSRAAPVGVGLVVLAAGALQLTPWKARHLTCCRRPPPPPATARVAWRHGVRLGVHCGACCAALTAALLVVGVMDLAVMAAVTVAITAERLAPAGARVARAVGAILVAAGLFLIARSVWMR